STTRPSGSCTSSAHRRSHGRPSATSRRARVSQGSSERSFRSVCMGFPLDLPGLKVAGIFGHMDRAVRSQLVLDTPDEVRPRIVVEGRGNARGEQKRDEGLSLRNDQGVVSMKGDRGEPGGKLITAILEIEVMLPAKICGPFG